MDLNQWQSLTCMLNSSVPKSPDTMTTEDTISTFTFQEYGVEIKFDRNPYLVDILLEASFNKGSEKDNESVRAMKKHYAMINEEEMNMLDQTLRTDGPFTSSSTSTANASDLYPLKPDSAYWNSRAI
ncbi:hypothetical protein Bca52824_066487 [Brassica carinata]|uniref:Trichome birefringence-like C-terminal domain-containing protein n=1 Tax=Brassica carinata TaxID=52824 RepID=A0A8X7QLY4_BRACI|nr:hypothetical protein Bca52824_066487 [Brassica carinata]